MSVERGDANISLNPDDESYIYTAALKVPIAEKNLVEGEEEANVYSEYSALYESEVTPYIAAVIDESKDQKDYSCTRSVKPFLRYIRRGCYSHICYSCKFSIQRAYRPSRHGNRLRGQSLC